ncbi:type VI secretion system baseplate subunit TssK [Klebsiella aerogenes]|uniref:type VI secretion system baseplate subunit TssK n=1 Tax=Klebsiella aerogenes TaxID=548 RepID=UPI00075022D9|nr:type VI secretion system baseplate subunit TssK [Klebsiella aerogenes]EIV6848831.1 type VI secretion system baseplate subunit TssK [Klebsiella aerogenes]EKU6154908.1 type VI secretion system baseplate subunit TssK [Klebsiella aerogenes]KUQ12576.1 type VI secretion protein [Klebsiella aerogenes]KZQ03589.1 type VI secretion protein [Klebsiella aerogenes]WPO55003.1 type VI secretion system baseplate subunit TssK [Klebsiella aerogenes]
MNKAEKVVWTEGMFLRPHHFQRAESYLQTQIREWGGLQRSWLWGFLEIELDDAMLRQGCIALSYASGLLPDGTFFQFRDARQGPAPLQIPDNVTGEKVVLALPVRRGGREEVIFSEEKDSLARFTAFEQDVEDDNALSVGDATVQFARPRLTLMLEKDLTAEWTAIGVAFIAEKRNDNAVKLDNGYIPPMLNGINHPLIYAMINDLHGLLAQRSQQIGSRLRQPGRFNTSELIEFTLLALVNRHLGHLSHLKTLPLVHPESLWNSWLPFAAELTTWMAQRAPDAALPIYDHDDLASCFGKLMLLLRQGLSQVMEDNAIQLPLIERSHGLNIATVPESSMVRDFGFVLAVKASVPGDVLQTHFPAQMKVAPVSKIRDLVQLQLPGLILRAMPAAPPQIPWHAGYNYFAVEKGGELWNDMEKSGAFALHLAGEFPGLDMEFWAIRSPSE